MQKRRMWGNGVRTLVLALFAIGVAITGTSTVVLAVESSSSNYQVTEWQFGSDTSLNSCSGSYCSQVTIGDPNATYVETLPDFGEVKTDEPLLEVIVTPGESNLGVLSSERTATKTTFVKIRNNYEGGYSLQISGTPPKFKNHTLAASSTPTASTPGTEQFGINLVANTSPNLGASPVQMHGKDVSETIFGQPTADYNVSNLFKYIDGDIIAKSELETGRTDYTISMIVNISNTTPAGHYTSDFTLFVVPSI